MELISQKNLNKLIEMGFKLKYQSENSIRLFHKEHPFGIDLYHSEPRDDYQGVYMCITDVNGIEIKEGKGRNVISNSERWIRRFEK